MDICQFDVVSTLAQAKKSLAAMQVLADASVRKLALMTPRDTRVQLVQRWRDINLSNGVDAFVDPDCQSKCAA